MNKIAWLLIIFLIIYCKNNASSEVKKEINTAENKVSHEINFDWLLGDWKQTNEEEGKATFEHWVKVNETEYNSLAYTMKGTDTIWRENVKLLKVNDLWSFDVIGLGDSLSTSFKVIKMDSVSFVCENQKNKFPKMISYFKNGTNIRAEISGGDMVIPFEFDKMNQ